MSPVVEHDTAPVPREAPRASLLAWTLAVAYLLTIIYASLQPFRNWRFPSDETLRFLTAPWPRYLTVEDVLVNLIAYVPLGLLFALALKRRRSAASAVVIATVIGTALSLSVESIQMFLPSRIASNVDLLINSVGALVGATAAPLLSPTGLPGRWLVALRQRWLACGPVADAGLVMTCLWLITQGHPTAQLFGTGYLRGIFNLPALFSHTPRLLFAAEASVVMLNLAGLGLLISVLARGKSRQYAAIALVVGLGILIKSATVTALFDPPASFVWLTPGVALGLLVGTALLGFMIRLPRSTRIRLAAFCFSAAVLAINLAPDNPYQAVPQQLLMGGPSHLLSFSGIVRALSALWPYLVLPYLVAASVGPFAQSAS